MHEIIAIANDFISRGQREGLRDLNAFKLHTLVYLVYCYWMVRGDAPEIRVYASREGVFLPELREHGCWGSKRVANPISLLEESDATPVPLLRETIPRLAADHAARHLMDWVWNTYRRRSAYDLGVQVREHGSPWDQVWNHPSRNGGESCEIPQEILRRWFADVIQQRLGAVRPAVAMPSAMPQPIAT
ncbi:MAG TPA: hypothetical protein VN046_05950 [Stenotrophobium sp.]|jgi:uncharacterized phage-associated protein|nr:hypothetical protein [Stenotrophobium sp.]